MARSAHLNNFQSAKVDMGFGGEEEEAIFFLHYLLFIYLFENNHLTSNIHIQSEMTNLCVQMYLICLFSRWLFLQPEVK